MKPRVVFDCVAFLQGGGRPNGPARACFGLVDAGAAELCLGAEVLAEVRGVLTRPKLQKRFPLLTPELPQGTTGREPSGDAFTHGGSVGP